MDLRNTFLIELLDKLGVPLMGAVQVHGHGDGAPDKDAKVLAAMLGQSVQLGLAVAQKLDLKEGQGDADAVRLSLSAMAGKLVGDSYRQTGRLPNEADTARMTRALEAVLTFADNFTPSAEHAARLRSVGTDRPVFDMAQSQIFYLSAMEPVLAAIAEFPFGQNETTLIQTTAENLQSRAANLREAMIGASAEKAESAFAELMILHSLARIYADCHRSETARILSNPDQSTAPSLEPVWKGFDLRLAMLETLLNVAVPGEMPESAPPKAPVPIAPPQAQAPVAVPIPATPVVEAPLPPPPQHVQPAPGPAAPPGGPMGFFAKKPVDAVPSTPATPAAAPPAAPPAEGGSPMAFFKPGVKKEDSEGQ
jgi:hypothetical protein